MRPDIYARNISKYIKEREKMLKHFRISLQNDELEHLHTLTTEIAVDNFIRDIIHKKL